MGIGRNGKGDRLYMIKMCGKPADFSASGAFDKFGYDVCRGRQVALATFIAVCERDG